MNTRTIALTSAAALAASALAWTTLNGGQPSLVRQAALAPAEPVRIALSQAAPAGLPAARADRPAPKRPRAVRPLPLTTCEEFWVQTQPIFDTLPHLDRADIHKLRYFCPADFNKDDQVDEHDIAIFGESWSDESSPLFNWCDLTGDGFVDEADAIEFLRQYREGPRNGEELKEQRSIIC